uniref:Uncharacterized protein n=1 Tax=Fagus sylvatica TaxID=28930 RepID=A0A2N9HMU9_FAGSY
MGVSRFADNNLGPPLLEGYVSGDSVLHRLATELYSIVYPAISTWGVVRDIMAANKTEWPLSFSNELPEGLSSPKRESREVSSEVTPSTSGPRPVSRISDNVVLRIPDPDERACCQSLRVMWPFMRSTSKQTLLSCMVMWRVSSNEQEDLTVEEFLFCYEPCQIAASPGFWTFKHRDLDTRIVQGLPSSNKTWKDGSWGTPSPSVLDRPLLNSVWKERISRILDIEDRRCSVFLEPDLFASFSFGLEPNTAFKALLRANKKKAKTMKLNKGKLRKFAQSGDIVVPLVSLKRKKADEGPSKPVELSSSHLPVRDAVPLVKTVPSVIMVDVDPTLSADSSEGLNEAMVMSQMCIAVEEDLATLRGKLIANEVEMKNCKRAVLELTKDRKEAVIELEKVRAELKARDDDVKVAVEAKDKAVTDLQHLVGQIEGAKVAAVL